MEIESYHHNIETMRDDMQKEVDHLSRHVEFLYIAFIICYVLNQASTYRICIAYFEAVNNFAYDNMPAGTWTKKSSRYCENVFKTFFNIVSRTIHNPDNYKNVIIIVILSRSVWHVTSMTFFIPRRDFTAFFCI